jgi:hypothetical protein
MWRIAFRASIVIPQPCAFVSPIPLPAAVRDFLPNWDLHTNASTNLMSAQLAAAFKGELENIERRTDRKLKGASDLMTLRLSSFM